MNQGKVAGIVAELQKRPEIVYLKEGQTLQDFYYDPTAREIVIHPRSGLQVSPGKVQTPALGFLHEAAHALRSLKDPKAYAAETVPIPGDPYDTKEEKRVIEKIETPAAIRLKEPSRKAHHAPDMKEVQVKCPTCSN